MTDRERIERTYAKIKEKHPDVTRKEDIDSLAIQYDKRILLLQSLAWLAEAVICSVIWIALLGNETYETTATLLFVMSVSGIFEFFRTIAKISKVEKRYRPVLKIKHEGQLTTDVILRDGNKVLKKVNYTYEIVRAPLHDKEDEIEVGGENSTYHTYYLQFDLGAGKTNFKVSKAVYTDAVIGAEYYLVVTLSKDIACIYQVTNWTLADELRPFIKESKAPTENVEPVNFDTADGKYRPNVSVAHVTPEKTKKLLPILALVIMLLAYFTPIIIGVPMALAAVVLTIIAVVQQRSKLSVISLIVCILLFVLLILSCAAIIMEAM